MTVKGNLRHTLSRGLAWVAAASSYVAILDILALILILKFWVGLADFGIATAVLAFHGTFELVAELGLTAAIIQKTTHSKIQLSTLYWLNITFGILVATCIFFCAPLFASLHDTELLTPLFRLYALHIIIRSLYSCHQALLKRELQFKTLSVIRLASNSGDFIIRITTAACGAGAWCFIYGLLARTIIEGSGVLYHSKWRPDMTFKPGSCREHLVFGIKTSASEALYRTYSNMDYWVVSLFFGPSALGLYRAAYELVLEPVRFLSLIVTSIAFPAFSRLKNHIEELTAQYVLFTKQNFIVISLFAACIFVSAEELLAVLFRPEYANAAWAGQIFACVGLLRAVSHLGPPLLDGLGKPGLTLRYQTFSAVLLTSFFFISATFLGNRYGLGSVAIAWLAGYPIGFSLLIAYVFSNLTIRPLEFAREMAPIALCMMTACITGFLARFITIDHTSPVQLAVGISATLFSYCTSLYFFTGITAQTLLGALRNKEEDTAQRNRLSPS